MTCAFTLRSGTQQADRRKTTARTPPCRAREMKLDAISLTEQVRASARSRSVQALSSLCKPIWASGRRARSSARCTSYRLLSPSSRTFLGASSLRKCFARACPSSSLCKLLSNTTSPLVLFSYPQRACAPLRAAFPAVARPSAVSLRFSLQGQRG